jgi:DNA polymerase-3 subunit epsilon
MEKFDNLIKKLEKQELNKDEFNECLTRLNKNFDVEVDIETLNFLGLPIKEDENRVFLRTKKNHFKDEVYCIVDIETNGNSPIKNQIIEIGAVKIKNGEIIDRFESYIYADYVPNAITKLTHITAEDLKDAPSLKQVLHDFKLFLGDAVFVAHNVQFDYNFISNSLKLVGQEELLNRKFCTVDLSRKTIEAPRHGLAFLREFLNIDIGEHHRAYADAVSAGKVLLECFKNIPENIKTTEDLIKFSNQNKKQKKLKKQAS